MKELKLKKLLAAVLITGTAFGLLGCRIPDRDAEKIMNKRTKEAMKEAYAQIGMPAIKNFQERKLAKMIFELRDREDLICYAYLKSDYTGKLVYLGKCIGYGLPYSVQYTNPMQVVRLIGGKYGTIPQADPNGLYMPTGLSATWLMMLDKDGNPRPVYIEPEIVVSPFPLH
ncbi:hypothetical protein DRJ17_04745 [Candidatus Woesearchaeota archaeon]|nr:MAG: hypothetical protein DRJ17_04745 [Candidatus Woesearchaeota archaeon]